MWYAIATDLVTDEQWQVDGPPRSLEDWLSIFRQVDDPALIFNLVPARGRTLNNFAGCLG